MGKRKQKRMDINIKSMLCISVYKTMFEFLPAEIEGVVQGSYKAYLKIYKTKTR